MEFNKLIFVLWVSTYGILPQLQGFQKRSVPKDLSICKSATKNAFALCALWIQGFDKKVKNVDICRRLMGLESKFFLWVVLFLFP